jgi:hypothetical protein
MNCLLIPRKSKHVALYISICYEELYRHDVFCVLTSHCMHQSSVNSKASEFVLALFGGVLKLNRLTVKQYCKPFSFKI